MEAVNAPKRRRRLDKMEYEQGLTHSEVMRARGYCRDAITGKWVADRAGITT